jgi:hypothetical protein
MKAAEIKRIIRFTLEAWQAPNWNKTGVSNYQVETILHLLRNCEKEKALKRS